MKHARRHDSYLPSWKDFLGASSRALESKLRLEPEGLDPRAELRPDRLPPWRQAAESAPWKAFLSRSACLVLSAVVIAHLAWILFTSTLILAYRLADPSVTILMAERAWIEGWNIEAPRDLPLRQVPVYLRSMLVAVEDGKFYEHHGLDFEAFQRAYEVNSRINRPMYGGSTLTMQVARILFLVPVKSYVRKYAEVIVALELELLLPKERILELYFGYAEWGKGLFGIEAAARHYYNTGVRGLSRDQGARLIALLSSPIRYTPGNLEKRAILRERYAYLVRRWVSPPAPAEAAGTGQGVQPAKAEAPPPATPEPGEEPASADQSTVPATP